MEEGKQATCRFCRQPIVTVHEINRWDMKGPLYWRHTDLERGNYRTEWDDHGAHCANTDNRPTAPHALPMEFCWMMKDDGFRCPKPVRDENMQGHFYACGTHMKKFVQQKEWAERRANEAENQESRAAMEEWEYGIYTEAMARLHECNAELFPHATIDRPRWKSWDRKVEVDIADFERWIRELMAYAPGRGGKSSRQDDDSLLGLFEQPQEAS